MRDWVLHAACAGLVDLMFDQTRKHQALRLCSDCPVLEDCVDDTGRRIRRGVTVLGVEAGMWFGVAVHRNARVALVPRVCLWCRETWLVDDESDVVWCSSRCEVEYTSQVGKHFT